MKKTQIAVAVIIGGALIAGAIVYSNQPSLFTEQEPTFKENFMIGCVGEDASYSYCECTYNDLKKTVGLDKMVSESLKYEVEETFSDEMYTEIMKSALKCS